VLDIDVIPIIRNWHRGENYIVQPQSKLAAKGLTIFLNCKKISNFSLIARPEVKIFKLRSLYRSSSIIYFRSGSGRAIICKNYLFYTPPENVIPN
jgi:hypothetical protein